MTLLPMILYLMIVIIIVSNVEFHSGSGNDTRNTTTTKAEPTYPNHRKLLQHGSCTNRDLSISQSKGSSSGIPQYIVEIVNTCVHGCATSNIHLHCGWFASAKMVNPKTFQRLSYDDCLVNGGRPLKTSQIIRFTYSNSFMYPITLKFADFC
ncbi:Protein TAPETUM DETERMINANT [Heracleum sosnowskyi]|uniref:Protein TAPETUM DETERMINANT n=1 Tax=Heracleum sosnowskyi TaxID=360622 RepID=A0AAD8IKM0_9APIA|nr:Protein TAPETUM DETERMINANT [Heracleum sosnowskyi]